MLLSIIYAHVLVYRRVVKYVATVGAKKNFALRFGSTYA